ncbi:MAG TPA: chromosome partitioning protein ParB, partial [Spirochaetota bacterium]|nr:chromosome partitioning protein ParB [Spirochaetota bacterium]
FTLEAALEKFKEAEALAKKWPISNKETQNKKQSLRELEIQNAEKELERKLQTKVQILGNSLKGKIQIEYFNQDEFERLLELFNLKII